MGISERHAVTARTREPESVFAFDLGIGHLLDPLAFMAYAANPWRQLADQYNVTRT
jgi:transposase